MEDMMSHQVLLEGHWMVSISLNCHLELSVVGDVFAASLSSTGVPLANLVLCT